MSDKPLMLYDGDCHFCRYWVLRWRRHTQGRVEYAPYQSEAHKFPQIPIERLQAGVQLVFPDGTFYSYAEAVFRALATVPRTAWVLWFYQHVPGVKAVAEFFYQVVGHHRGLFSKITRFLWGDEIAPAQYHIATWIFLRAIGAIYLIAFVSLWTQVQGLYGSDGIVPIAKFLQQVHDKYGVLYFRLPSIFWMGASDTTLNIVCGVGAACSALVMAGLVPVLGLAIAWFLYLSFLTVGGPFLSFQWDVLLLETGFLAIFLAPLAWRSRLSSAVPSKIVVFLVQFLLFKLMLSSGLVKLLSGDKTWRHLTALTFHYQTQPIPAWTSYYMHQFPAVVHKICTLLMFTIELGFAFLICAPRRLRYAACVAQVALQAVILLTGNYTFFNYLAIALCVMLLDDSVWPGWLRRRISSVNDVGEKKLSRRWPKIVTMPLLILILFLNAVLWPARLGARPFIPETLINLAFTLNNFQFVNNYGLFAVMTTTRSEIIVQGSDDEKTWLDYEFKYKPGDLQRRPVFVAPHQPRLDWQMWFAALGTYRENPWFVDFCVRLLQNSKPVTRLLAKNPFPDHAPRHIRAVIYDYEFTTLDEKRKTGCWWKRSNEREYLPPISLRS